MKTPIDIVFDEFSATYTERMIRYVPYYLTLLEKMVSELPNEYTPETVLELGCGNGNATKIMLHHFPKAKFHLVDASKEMIQLCRERYSKTDEMTFEVSYFQEMDWPTEQYDLVFAGITLHHLKGHEKREVFNNIHSSLKPGGIFTSCDLMMNKNNPAHPDLIQSWKNFVLDTSSKEDWQWLMDHYDSYDHPDDYDDQEYWLKEMGFSKIIRSWHEGPWTCFHAWK